MNKRLPYEEQLAEQLNHVSLPDENMAWADMKRRLERDDDNRFIPFWLNGCFLWALFGVIILTLGWWIVRPEKWFEKKNVKPSATIAITQPKEKEQDDLLQNKKANPDSSVFFETSSQQNETAQNNNKEAVHRIGRKRSSTTSLEENTMKENSLKIKRKRTEQFRYSDKISKNKNSIVGTNKSDDNSDDSISPSHQIFTTDSTNIIAGQSIDTTKAAIGKNKNDSMARKQLAKKDKSDSSKSPAISFAAGLSLFQQLPIGGKNFVPYDREGRKGTLADYIPSIFIRMYQKNNWFIQSEFRYGAPQYTKEFVYQQRADSVLNGFITQSTSLKKTYYHQLPLTFNYFVSKNLSVGTGIMWNKFVSAISSQDIVKHNNITGTDSIISKRTIVISKNDSGNFFVRSWFQALFQAEYKWNRFSLGARYAIGLDPYIKFELHPGRPQQEKNSAIDIFIRYELWRSKKK